MDCRKDRCAERDYKYNRDKCSYYEIVIDKSRLLKRQEIHIFSTSPEDKKECQDSSKYKALEKESRPEESEKR
jgi:hypothetical protein